MTSRQVHRPSLVHFGTLLGDYMTMVVLDDEGKEEINDRTDDKVNKSKYCGKMQKCKEPKMNKDDMTCAARAH